MIGHCIMRGLTTAFTAISNYLSCGALIALYLESGDREALEERAAYQFRLLGSGLPPFEEGELKAALEFFDVTLDVLMDVEWGPRGRELLQFHDRFDDMTAAVCQDPSVSSRMVPAFYVSPSGFLLCP